jgi:hypothetical protein
MKKRNAFSLGEMVLVVAMLAIVMSIGTGIIHGLMKTNSAAHEGLFEQNTFARLAAAFRADVRAADEFSQVKPEGDATAAAWTLTRRDGAKIRYEVESRKLVRLAEPTTGASREEFDLPEDVPVAIEQRDEHGATLVTLTVGPGKTRVGAKGLAARGLRVDAQLGRDRTLAETVAKSPPEAKSDKKTSESDSDKPAASADEPPTEPEEEPTDE